MSATSATCAASTSAPLPLETRDERARPRALSTLADSAGAFLGGARFATAARRDGRRAAGADGSASPTGARPTGASALAAAARFAPWGSSLHGLHLRRLPAPHRLRPGDAREQPHEPRRHRRDRTPPAARPPAEPRARRRARTRRPSATAAASISARATGSPHRSCIAPSSTPTGTARQRSDQAASSASAAPAGVSYLAGVSYSAGSGIGSPVARPAPPTAPARRGRRSRAARCRARRRRPPAARSRPHLRPPTPAPCRRGSRKAETAWFLSTRRRKRGHSSSRMT